MSVQAIAWVLEHADTSSVGDRLVLLSLANHADRHGRGAFPKVEDISHEARLSTRQVTRALGRLEQEGFIESDEWPQDRLPRPANRRPKCWRLTMPRGDIQSSQDVTPGVTSTTPRGDIHSTPGVTSDARYKEEPSLEPSLAVLKDAKASSADNKPKFHVPDRWPYFLHKLKSADPAWDKISIGACVKLAQATSLDAVSVALSFAAESPPALTDSAYGWLQATARGLHDAAVSA